MKRIKPKLHTAKLGSKVCIYLFNLLERLLKGYILIIKPDDNMLRELIISFKQCYFGLLELMQNTIRLRILKKSR